MPKTLDDKLPWGLTKVEPGSIRLTKHKIDAFELGSCTNGKKSLSKKEQDDFKKKQDEEATAEVLQDFVDSFGDQAGKSFMKKFVKGAVINPGSKEEKRDDDSGTYYKPSSKLYQKLSKKEHHEDEKKIVKSKKNAQEKRKSNLELFKEELKKIQEEREARDRNRPKSDDKQSKYDHDSIIYIQQQQHYNKHANDESVLSRATTNVFLSNLSPSTYEKELMELFGQYGPLASVKIMWPRTEEERMRGNNCGFVAFMRRDDADKALNELNGTVLNGLTMRLSWSKAVNLPSMPIYVAPDLLDATQAPPSSGLPFNAQLVKSHAHHRNSDILRELNNSTVKVTIPTDRTLLCLIHRMVEFVVREGPQFESIIMKKEANNQQFRYLMNQLLKLNILMRILLLNANKKGDSICDWYTSKFQMFKNGSYWQPPRINKFTKLGNDESYEHAKNDLQDKKGQLSDEKRDKLEDILRNLTPERTQIANAMIFCIENSNSSREIVECLIESLSIAHTPLNKKIARLFLVSDILHNCGSVVKNSYMYRIEFQKYLPELFKHINLVCYEINDLGKREVFKNKILSCIRAWIDLAIYPMDFLATLQNNILAVQSVIDAKVNSSVNNDTIDGKPLLEGIQDYKSDSEDIDGEPMNESDADIDGEPLDEGHNDADDDNDIDGKPMDEDIDGQPLSEDENDKKENKFIVSKWEAVNPEELEKQAVTTSKWDLFDEYNSNDGQTETSKQFKKELERKLNEINDDQLCNRNTGEYEHKAVKYKDELEIAKVDRNKHMSVNEQHDSSKVNFSKKDMAEQSRERSRSNSPKRYKKKSRH